MPLLASQVESWPPAYARALHAIQALTRESEVTTVGAICGRMNQTRSSDSPEFDEDLVRVVLRNLTTDGHLVQGCSIQGKSEVFQASPSAPVIDSDRIGHRFGSSSVPAAGRNGTSKNGTSAHHNGSNGNATAMGGPIGSTRTVSSVSSAKPKPAALAAEAPQKRPVVAAKVAAPAVPGRPVSPAPNTATKPKPQQVAKPAEVLPVSSHVSPKSERVLDVAEAIIRSHDPKDWFVGDEFKLPDNVTVGRFKGACSNLSKSGVLERKSHWVNSVTCIYVYRLRR